MKPEILSSESIYQGKIFDLSIAEVREGDISYKREIISHPGSAVIVPVFADQTVALVRQYRHPTGKYLLELPAGSLNRGEEAEAGAIRELEEEIGVTAEKIEKLSEFYVSPGFLSEKMYLFLATGLTDVGQKLEDDEILNIEKVSFPQAFELIQKGEIEDAKTIIGLITAGTGFGFIFKK